MIGAPHISLSIVVHQTFVRVDHHDAADLSEVHSALCMASIGSLAAAAASLGVDSRRRGGDKDKSKMSHGQSGRTAAAVDHGLSRNLAERALALRAPHIS
jgi:hypothetical protein